MDKRKDGLIPIRELPGRKSIPWEQWAKEVPEGFAKDVTMHFEHLTADSKRAISSFTRKGVPRQLGLRLSHRRGCIYLLHEEEK